MIKIVTDTGACLPQDILQQSKIMLLPGHIAFGEETFVDHYEIPSAEFYHRLSNTKEIPVFIDPAPEQFKTLYGKIHTAYPEATILSIHTSGKIAETVGAAQKAAASLPKLAIHIFDTQSIGVGQGLLVQEAARLANTLDSVSAIINYLTAMRDGMQQYFMLNTLDYLARTGRAGSIGHLSSMVDIKPILAIKKGEIIPFRQYRTHAQALDALRSLVLQPDQGTNKLRLGIMHSADEAEAQQLVDELQTKLSPEVCLFTELGAGVASLFGPGAIGVCWWAPRSVGMTI